MFLLLKTAEVDTLRCRVWLGLLKHINELEDRWCNAISSFITTAFSAVAKHFLDYSLPPMTSNCLDKAEDGLCICKAENMSISGNGLNDCALYS